ncbi:hypothetical protein NE237_005139 [Protea cynaroides]|uniref:Uncharacterized protein n=1 Tax=Protea cynaroides TaxID=273540 RepID=A0A9Q0QU00_9MAGN|nr:hypothetical protein NE237_005139 [Protea cynaroides]
MPPPLPPASKPIGNASKKSIEKRLRDAEKRMKEQVLKKATYKASNLDTLPFIPVFDLYLGNSAFESADVAQTMLETTRLPKDMNFLANLSDSDIISRAFMYMSWRPLTTLRWRRSRRCLSSRDEVVLQRGPAQIAERQSKAVEEGHTRERERAEATEVKLKDMEDKIKAVEERVSFAEEGLACFQQE